MALDGTGREEFPLRAYLRACVDRIVDSFAAAVDTPGGSPERRALDCFLRALEDLGRAVEGLAEEAAPPSIVLVGGGELAEEIRSAGTEVVALQGAADFSAITETLQRKPAVLVAGGAQAAEWIARVRQLHPGFPAIAVVDDEQAARAVETFAADPVIVLRSSARAELPLAVRAIAALRSQQRDQEDVGAQIDARSYAHLAGLLPRALERTISFDIGASVITRPGMETIVDVYSPAVAAPEALQWVRQRASALYEVVRGGARKEPFVEGEAAAPVRSCLYTPLALGGRVVGLTYLASFKDYAFTADDERVLVSLATHASGAYRKLEASLHQMRLSPRQSQVLALIASGLSDKEVASRLGVAHRTVRTHVDRMLREHGFRSRTEAVAAWLRGQQEDS